MSGNSDQVKLERIILSKSVEKVNFSVAAKEWILEGITWKADHCICDHHIVQNCHIVNTLNGATATVGNVCIFKFMGWDLSAVFACLREIKKDPLTAWNSALCLYIAYKRIFEQHSLPLAITIMTKSAKAKSMTDEMKALRVEWNTDLLEKFTK